MTKEVWRDVRWYRGIYQVSSLGAVRSVDREILVDDKRSSVPRIRRYKGKQLRPVVTNTVLSVHLSYKGVRDNKLISHIVAEAFVLPRYPGCAVATVNYLNKNFFDCRLCNLVVTLDTGEKVLLLDPDGPNRYSNVKK